jgi:putative proteasome-type protease
MLIYPQGNHIEASKSTPYLQIGETKYGKPVLDRVLRYDLPLNDAARLGLVSLSSTTMSNITVGPPYELSIYQVDQFRITSRCRFEEGGDYLNVLQNAWTNGLIQIFNNLPRFDWELQENQMGLSLSECEIKDQAQNQE